MKIKIKIKTLILLILVLTIVIVWLLPNSFLLIARAFENNSPEKASIFYDRYANYPTTFSIKGDYYHARSLIKGFSKFIKYFNSWGGGDDTSPENMEKAIVILEDMMKKSPSENEEQYYIDSYKMLLDLAIAKGDAGLLKEWISFGQNSNKEKIGHFADLYKAFLLHVSGDRKEARKILESLEGENFEDVNLDVLRAEINLFEGNYKKAQELYEDINNYNWTGLQSGNFGSQGYFGRSDWFDWVYNDLKGDNVIRGTVTYEGRPLPFMEIYVQAADGGIRVTGESYIGISDEKGNFETLGLKDGVYNIGFGIDGSLLTDRVVYASESDYFELDSEDGEIHFDLKDILEVLEPEGVKELSQEDFTVSWEEVEGAVYYTIEIVSFIDPYERGGGSSSIPVYDEKGEIKHSKTSARIHMDFQRDEIGGFSLGEDGLISPNAVLGLFLPGIEYPIVVNAYDHDENLITSSLPLRTYFDKLPSIKVEGSLSEGEKLILNQDYRKAIAYYEDILIENPDNTEALRYLTKIYGIGWKDGEKNIERAIELGTRLSHITGSDRLLNRIVGMMTIDEIKEYPTLYKSTILDGNGPMDYYDFSQYYIAMGDWESARDALKEEESYVRDELVYLDIYFGDYGEARENAKYTYTGNLSSTRFKEALIELENNPPEANEKEVLDRFLIELVKGFTREEGKKLYKETMHGISNRSIGIILNEIYRSRGWDIED